MMGSSFFNCKIVRREEKYIFVSGYVLCRNCRHSTHQVAIAGDNYKPGDIKRIDRNCHTCGCTNWQTTDNLCYLEDLYESRTRSVKS